MFAKEHTYEDNRLGIFIPVIPGSGVEEVELLAKIDTGADVCVFQHKYGELLKIDVESGRPQRMETVTGYFDTFEHLITIETFGVRVESHVLFAAREDFSRNVPGRRGWLDRIRLGLIDYEQLALFSSYD